MPKLGVNIDHVATLRQARRGEVPDPVAAAKICEKAGADSIVVHLREDRRHINEHDVRALRRSVTTWLNLEMSINKDIVAIACRIKPDQATLVPEKRQEITTEGGLNVLRHFTRIRRTVRKLQSKGIVVSLFIDPVKTQIARSKETGVTMIELHTGRYAEAKTPAEHSRELRKLNAMTRYGRSLGLVVNAGHGLNYENTGAVARISGITELNTGHSIISHAVFVGLAQAVRQMRKLSRGTQR